MPVNPNSQTVFEMDCHPYMTSQSFINGTTGQPPCYQKQFNGQDTVLIPSISSPIMSTSVESSLQNNLPAMHCSSQRNIAGAINQPPYYQQQLNTECTVLISSISSPITSNFINISSKNHLSQRQYLSKQNININTPSTYDPLDVKFSPTDVIFLSNDDEWPLNLPIGPYFQDKPILKCIQKRFMKIHRPYYIKRIPQQLVSIVTTCQCDDCKNDENEKLTTHHDSFDQSTPTHDLPPPDLKSSPKNVIIATNDYEWPSNDNNTMTPINSFPWKSPYPTDLSTLKSNKISYIEATSQDIVQISSIDLMIMNLKIKPIFETSLKSAKHKQIPQYASIQLIKTTIVQLTNHLQIADLFIANTKYNNSHTFSKLIWNWKTTRKKKYSTLLFRLHL